MQFGCLQRCTGHVGTEFFEPKPKVQSERSQFFAGNKVCTIHEVKETAKALQVFLGNEAQTEAHATPPAKLFSLHCFLSSFFTAFLCTSIINHVHSMPSTSQVLSLGRRLIPSDIAHAPLLQTGCSAAEISTGSSRDQNIYYRYCGKEEHSNSSILKICWDEMMMMLPPKHDGAWLQRCPQTPSIGLCFKQKSSTANILY